MEWKTSMQTTLPRPVDTNFTNISPYNCGKIDAETGNAKKPHYYSNGSYVKLVNMTELQLIEYYAGYNAGLSC